MMSSYFQSTYNSGRLAQTYLLASKVKAKLTQEAVRNDVDLHRLVCQANLLDNLIENLNHHESSYTNGDVCYDSIGSNIYPLLNNVTVDVNSLDYVENVSAACVDDEDDDEDDEVNENEIKIEKAPFSDVYYTSDDSDFDSDEESDSSFNSDNLANVSTDPNELCCIALQRLNLHCGIEDDIDDNQDANSSVTNTTISVSCSDTDSASDSDSETESDIDFDEDGGADGLFSGNYCALMRMHSQHTSLSLNDYVESSEVVETPEADTSVQDAEACNSAQQNNSNPDEVTHEEELPSLSNCSSFSSMEEISQPNQNIIKFECSDATKHQQLDSPQLYSDQNQNVFLL